MFVSVYMPKWRLHSEHLTIYCHEGETELNLAKVVGLRDPVLICVDPSVAEPKQPAELELKQIASAPAPAPATAPSLKKVLAPEPAPSTACRHLLTRLLTGKVGSS
jgi:hypothetical protein